MKLGTRGFIYVFLSCLLLVCGASSLAWAREVSPDQPGVPVVPPPGIPAPASVESPLPDSINVYRYGNPKQVSLKEVATLSQLVKAAQQTFSDPKIARILSMTGKPLTSLAGLLKMAIKEGKELQVIALAKEERFIWPALRVGDEVSLEVNGRQVTVRTLATQPRIFEIDNLIDPAECDHIIQKAQTYGMMRSRVGDDSDTAFYDQSRTSSQLWVGPLQNNDDEVFEAVRNRVYNLTRLPSELGEDTQVVFYGPNQHYYAHHDYTRKEYVLDNPYYAQGGNRLVTVLYYLNDVEEGGETGFPYVNSHRTPDIGIEDYSRACEYGLKIKPKKGGAAMFYSLTEEGHMDGNVDPWSLHAGCDVFKGEKWLANQWIRNKRVNGMLFGEHY